jgi:TPR repeat protein
VPRNAVEAARWYRKAAEQGNANGQRHLATLYEKGVGVPRDAVLAMMWAILAAEQDDADAIAMRDRLAKLLGPAQVNEAKKLATAWKPAVPR